MVDQFAFQFCQKIVIFSKDKQNILLAQRKSEEDFDGVFSFIGGKMELTDTTILEGIKREKNEEIGENAKIKIYPDLCSNLFFEKKSGDKMILPHYYAIFESGDISLNEEYSCFKWVPLDELNSFEPKIPSIPKMVVMLKQYESILDKFESHII